MAELPEKPATIAAPFRRPARSLPLLVGILGILAVAGISQWYREHLVADARTRLRGQVQGYGQRLASSVGRRVALLEGLKAFASEELEANGHIRREPFAGFSRRLATEFDGVRALALVSATGITLAYPPTQEQAFLKGLHPPAATGDPGAARGRIDTGRDKLPDRPPLLQQRGEELVGLAGILSRGAPWGQAVIILEFPTLLHKAGLLPPPEPLRLALRNSDGALLFGKADLRLEGAETINIHLPGETWHLLAAPAKGWMAPLALPLLLLWSFGLATSLGLALLTYAVIRREEALSREVQERTVALDAELASRNRSEQALQRERRTLQAFLDALPEFAMLLDPDGRVLACNRMVRERLGLDPGDPSRDNLLAVLPPALVPERRQMIGEVVATGSERHFIDQLEGRTIANYLHPVIRESGQVRQLAHIGIDITDRAVLEQRLRHVQKIEAVGTLSGGIAHEFNNILTAVIGQASLLEMKLTNQPSLTEHVRQILLAADRGEKLTRALLAFSRRRPSHPATVDLNDIVRPLGPMLAPLLGSRIRLLLDLAEMALPVKVDPDQIEQVLINLVINAKDAMPQGGAIDIATAHAPLSQEIALSLGGTRGGEFVRLSLRDTGSGIDKETISRIFEPFFTTKQVGRGTGLGLSVALGIVQQNQGFLSCDSTPGLGTRFDLYFPMITDGDRS